MGLACRPRVAAEGKETAPGPVWESWKARRGPGGGSPPRQPPSAAQFRSRQTRVLTIAACPPSRTPPPRVLAQPTLQRCDTSLLRGVSLPRPPSADPSRCVAHPPPPASSSPRLTIVGQGPFTVPQEDSCRTKRLRGGREDHTTCGGRNRPGLLFHRRPMMLPLRAVESWHWVVAGGGGSSARRHERGAWTRGAADTSRKSEEHSGAPAGGVRCRGVRCPAGCCGLAQARFLPRKARALKWPPGTWRGRTPHRQGEQPAHSSVGPGRGPACASVNADAAQSPELGYTKQSLWCPRRLRHDRHETPLEPFACCGASTSSAWPSGRQYGCR